MTDRDFSLGGRDFKLGKLDAFKQFHIVRRVAPILADLLPALKNAQAGPGDLAVMSEDKKLDMVGKFATPIMSGLSQLSDADAELVLYGLLSSVEMKQPAGNWARVATGTMLMIQDLELPQLLQIAGRAFMFNLSGFFAELPRQT